MNLAIFGGVGAIALAGLLSLGFCHPDPRIQQARDQAVTAVGQDHLNQGVTAIGQQAQAKTVKLEITTREAVHDVEIAPGASSPVPPDVLRTWGAGIDRLRAASDTADPGPPAGHSATEDSAELPPT